ncbi:MAG: Gfo/Idh/MocA family oxidoreductase [Armatimonadetes bacterium]|nr:Gfo/Idh/MocA family oxidoreductase [Armatimonadota bacterium]
MAGTVQAALLGCGHPHSAMHLQTLASLVEVSRIHLWDPDPEVARRLAADPGPTPVVVHAELNHLLDDPQVAWLLVALRNDLAPEVLLRCAAAGKPVLAEKPLGRSAAEVAPIVQAFRAAGQSLAVCFQNRYKPAARQIRAWLAEDHLGRLCTAETRLHTTQVRLRDPRHWLFQQQVSGGGILPWLGCHYLDLLRYLMAAEVVAVTAQCATLSGEAIDVEDVAVMTLRFDNEVLATATFGYLMPGGQPGYAFPGYDSYLALKGTGGQIDWPVAAAEQSLQVRSQAEVWAGAPERRLTFKEETARAYGGRAGLEFDRDCLTAALEGRDGPTTGEDMLAIWRIIEAAYRSEREGVRVDLTAPAPAGQASGAG